MEKPSAEAAVTIVGGGPSGLATAAALRNLSIPYTLLEREECFAPLWQKYAYERVHLHVAKELCQLPHMPIPAAYPTYISRQHFVQSRTWLEAQEGLTRHRTGPDFVSYLNDYVSRFSIAPRYRRSVESAALHHGQWRVEARNLDSGEVEEYRSRFLVVATGITCDARTPEIEGLGSFAGEVLHSTEYKSGGKFAGKKVLVVGSGNSGMEIALDLANFGAKTSIVVRSPTHVLSRKIVYVSHVLLKHISMKWVDCFATMMSKFVYGDLSKYGIQRPKMGPFALMRARGKYPVVDVGTMDKIKSGHIQVLPGIRSIKQGNCVLFENDEKYKYDVLIFATGFKRSTKHWLKEEGEGEGDNNYMLSEDGLPEKSFPNHWKGKNGLYCAGLTHRGLYGASMDAHNIALHIKNHFT